MISPVEKYTEEELEEEVAFKNRPEWIKWKYAAYWESTASWDDDQVGWYDRLLNLSAMAQRPAAGYLPDDEYELKEMAGFKELNPGVAWLIGHGVVIPDTMIEAMKEARERKWMKVRRKFVSARKYPGYIYNRKLLTAIETAYKNTKLQIEHGKSGRNKQILKRQEERELAAGSQEASQEPSQEASRANLILSSSLSSKLTKDSTKTLELKTEKRGLVLEEATGKEEYIQEGLVLTPPEQTKKGKHRRAPETVFDEEKFIITALMKQHLFEKYPELDDGDLEWMRYKFCNVYHNTKYASWSRTFYNFVFNQITKYDYEPGSYKRRKDNGGLNVAKKQKPWESASERNSRLEQEAAEYTRKLRGGSVGDTAVDSPGLTLGSIRDD